MKVEIRTKKKFLTAVQLNKTPKHKHTHRRVSVSGVRKRAQVAASVCVCVYSMSGFWHSVAGTEQRSGQEVYREHYSLFAVYRET